ncbi:PLP-dependent lyase/thiolase [Patescibacteria group bacterium]|nr:PLP-dependent lyase/thiolase [Patescibacteria group bacterium]
MGDAIPVFPEADPHHPEWQETPIIPLDLSPEGYGELYVKNEADRTSNPTGTIKDRAAWELATLYRDFARALYFKLRLGRLTKEELKNIPVPRLSFMTSGNEGRAVAERFKLHDLPPPKLIVSQDILPAYLESLKVLRADLYAVDLDEALDSDAIRCVSNNEGGIDITSVRSLQPQAIFYDWHVHESFNFSPDKIFVPYGSGRLAENYLYWQMRTMRNEGNNTRDPRLKAHVGHVVSMDILAAEPSSPTSVADKLTAPFKPFLLFKDSDINALTLMNFTGRGTSKNPVSESSIDEAFALLKSRGIRAEPSGAASLALYLTHFRLGLIGRKEKILVVNTGEGLFDPHQMVREFVEETLSESGEK